MEFRVIVVRIILSAITEYSRHGEGSTFRFEEGREGEFGKLIVRERVALRRRK